tara:strand:- start:6206 stop:8047 length:1842 start_codon:yes stop_codon:yes gene_type:complete
MLEQKKKTDFNSVIGFALIGLVLFWYTNEQTKVDQVLKDKKEFVLSESNIDENKIESTSFSTPNKLSIINDSTLIESFKDRYGAFALAASKEYTSEKFHLKNDLIDVEISLKGGRVTSVILNNYFTYDSLALNLLREDSSIFNLSFWSQNRRLETSDFVFDAYSYQQGSKQFLSLRISVDENRYLEYLYALEQKSYKVDFVVNFVGLEGLIQQQNPIVLDWGVNIPSQELSIDNEAMNTSAYFYKDGEADNLSSTSDDTEVIIKPDWISFKSQYFSTILSASDLTNEIELNTITQNGSTEFVKYLHASTELYYNGADNSYEMDWYYVPNHVNTLKSYGIGLEDLVPLGWSIIGWINKFVVINIFNAFEDWGFSYGIIILLMALLIKIVLFPFTYKSYTSMAKMRVLKPQIDAFNEKFEDPMKRQQETMNLYRQTGVSPLGGCIPMLFQMPILFALFRFFPSSIELRQQSFLWANDLSSYDSIFDLGFSIPFYGDHVSLFTLLMTGTTVLQMKMSNGMSGTNAQMPQMKYMMYFMPVIFLGVMNNYAAALSYYYFLANLITFGQQKMISAMIDDKHLLAKMEEKKQNTPKKGKSKFQDRLEKMMKDQQESKRLK